MARPFRQTVYSKPLIWTGAVISFVAALVLLAWVAELRGAGIQALPEAEAALSALGWGGLAELLLGIARSHVAHANQLGAPLPGPGWMPWVGGAGWLLGWGTIALGVRRNPDPELAEPPGIRMSRVDRLALMAVGAIVLVVVLQVAFVLFAGTAEALGIARFVAVSRWVVFGLILAGMGTATAREWKRAPEPAQPNPLNAPLNPQLARYVDFHWGTLAAYGGGILLAEGAVILVHTVLAGRLGVAPPYAIAIAGLLGMGIAFFAGFVGAANARRLSAPEATVALFYLGLPIPLLLMLRHSVIGLQLAVGDYLREITYVAQLIGRPEISYWLGFALLVLMMELGITTGFVTTGSGRINPRAGFELFVAGRHVHVFNLRFLFGTLLVLLLGIIPPLLILAMVRAAEGAVERTRIKRLGLRNPLDASEALSAAKLKEQTPTAMMTALSVGGVGVGVMALIIVLSVMSGFEDDLQRKILGTNAHGVVLKYGTDSFTDPGKVMAEIRQKVPGVVGETPFILNEVMITSDDQISGTVIKGIDPQTVGSVTDLPRNILPGGSVSYLEHPEQILQGRRLDRDGTGAVDDRPQTGDRTRGGSGRAGEPPKQDEYDELIMGGLDRTPPSEQGGKKAPVLPGIIVGKELAATMHVTVGDRINVVSPLGGELGPQGPMPKSRPFRVAGIFYSGMYEYDSKFVYVSLDAAKEFFGLQGVSGIEIKVKDIDDARRIMHQIQNVLGNYPFHTRDWGEMNKNLFSALRLEKLVMGIILSIIVIVAAGLIVATVIMLVLEKRKEISVLKALGVPDGGIVKIFLAEGLQIGIAGGLLGLIAGLGWCYAIEKVGIKLDPEVYYIPNLPVKIEPLQVAIPVVIAVLVTYLASIYPALKASRVEPVEGLKAE